MEPENVEESTQDEQRHVFGVEQFEISATPDDGAVAGSEEITPPANENAGGSQFTYKGREVKADEVQTLLKQAEHLDRLRGEQGNQLGTLRKENAEMREGLAELRGKVESSSGQASEQESKGQKWQELVLSDPDAAYQMMLEEATKVATESMSKQVDGKLNAVDQKANAAQIITNFYQAHPEMASFKTEMIGAKSIVEHAKDQLLQRASTDEILNMRLNSSEGEAFKLLAEEAQSLANRLGFKPTPDASNGTGNETPPVVNRTLSERGGTFPNLNVNSGKAKDVQFTPDEMRKQMLLDLRANRTRIKPSNASVLEDVK